MTDLKARIDDPALSPFERLVLVMKILRSPEGCAWDRKQTHQSLLPYLIEEAYEVSEAVEAGDMEELRDELGDLLCQVVFHAQLASERGEFSVDDAASSIVEKLVRRHPHVFGERKELDPRQVRDQWENIKLKSGEKESLLSGVPTSMPALTMAFRIGEKAGGVGFDWEQAAEVLEKIEEEVGELREALKDADKENRENISDEIGDLLFAVASLARKLDIDPERSLKGALKKFRGRFARLEDRIKASHRDIADHTLSELEAIWQAIKSDTERG
jgi:MazG family protein